MGVAAAIDGNIQKGSLFKFTNVLAVDFQDETFLNVGAYTDEQMILNLGLIRQAPIAQTLKMTL